MFCYVNESKIQPKLFYFISIKNKFNISLLQKALKQLIEMCKKDLSVQVESEASSAHGGKLT